LISLSDYTALDATGLAECIARGDMHETEVRDAAIRAIEVVNPRVNAILQVLPGHSRERGDDARSVAPFRGVPFAIKELTINAAGVPLDMGSRLLRGYRPAADTELMKRFRRAGLALIATTQTPELGYNPTTECVLHGPVHNPWDLARSAGGSSGGSGAAVAAGMVPLAHANDGGGSIRIPAGCNGLVGLKPSRDRIPTGPLAADPLCGLAIDFAVTRSVRDCAALLDAVAGPDLGAPSVCAPPVRPFRKEAVLAPPRLRIAFTTHAPSGTLADPECVAAVERTARTLADLGHEVTEAAPVLSWDAFLESVHVIWCAATAAGIDALAHGLQRTPSPDNLEWATWACYEEGRRLRAVDLLGALARQNAITRAVAPFFEAWDLMLTPTLPRPAALLGELDQNRQDLSAMDWTRQVFAYCPFTPLFNTTGQPAISLPLHWTAGGLPVGVQFAARFGDEALLLRIAGQLEAALPWAGRRPGCHAAA
jgi:amidase